MASDQASHALWVELTTRISSQHLHLKSGLEETAADSIYGLFRTTRELMVKAEGNDDFLWIAESLLNDLLRSYTARWHGWMTHDKDARDANGKPVMKFRDDWVRRQFRRELQVLQRDILPYKDVLAQLKAGQPLDDATKHQLAPRKGEDRAASLGAPLDPGIGEQVKFQVPLCEGNLEAAWRWCVNLATWIWFGEARAKAMRERCTQDRAAKTAEHQKQAAKFASEINAKEREELTARRKALADAEANDWVDARGLALSGGGIRSATFCLGIVQVLAKRQLLTKFDYLSTVSGGGYLGAFLSAYLGTGDREKPGAPELEEMHARIKEAFDVPEKPAIAASEGRREPRIIRHLRNRSRYLMDGGFWDTLTNVSMVLAGVVFNLLIVLPLPLIGALLTYFLRESEWLGNKNWLQSTGTTIACKDGVDPTMSIVAQSNAAWASRWDAPWSIALIVVACATALLALLFPDLRRKAIKEIRLNGRSPKLKAWGYLFNAALVLTLAAFAWWLVPLGFRLYHVLRESSLAAWFGGITQQVGAEKLFIGLCTVILAILSFIASHKSTKTRGKSGWWWRLMAGLSGPLLYLLVYFSAGYHLMFSQGEDVWTWPWVLGVIVILLLWAWLLVDVNTYSPHGYYRDRLSDCYLQSRRKADPQQEPGRSTEPHPCPRLRLTELGQCTTAPYHLINATLNVPSSTQRELRGRDSDFFMFSKHFSGSALTGYYSTHDLEEVDPHLDLGTVMAVSGAAASSNMGWKTDNSLRLIMTLANVRLGYWLKNPALGVPKAKKLHRPGLGYLFREMFAMKMDEHQNYLNLSDGGHIENLAVYELLRRRCKFIVCVDGGMEPGMECADLIRLERYAAIDLGIEMHYDLSDLTLQSNGYSRAYGVLVKIDYSPPATEAERDARKRNLDKEAQWGWMLYLKLAMVGYGPGYVMDYKRENPGFPHQSTGDQIYDEAQFEAYRALGEAAAESFFTSDILGKTDQNPSTIRQWFQSLAENLLPDNDEAFGK